MLKQLFFLLFYLYFAHQKRLLSFYQESDKNTYLSCSPEVHTNLQTDHPIIYSNSQDTTSITVTDCTEINSNIAFYFVQYSSKIEEKCQISQFTIDFTACPAIYTVKIGQLLVDEDNSNTLVYNQNDNGLKIFTSFQTFSVSYGNFIYMDYFKIKLSTGQIAFKNCVNLEVNNLLVAENNLTNKGTFLVKDVNQSLFQSCIFQENIISSQSTGSEQAGAIAFYRGTDVTITECNFLKNSVNAYYGGAINFSRVTGTISVSESLFEENTAFLQGGALRLSNCVNVIISDSIFNTNIVDGTKGLGGAVYINSNTGTITLNQNNMQNNSGNQGGGFYLSNVMTVQIDGESEFKNNQANEGGAIFILQFIQLHLINNDFSNNIAWTSQEIGNGGAIFIDCYSNNQDTIIQIKDNIFQSNKGISGGAIYLVNLNKCANTDDCILDGNEFHDNYVTTNGGAIFATTVDNLNFYNNNFDKNEADIVSYTLGGTLYLIEGTNMIFENCTIANGSASQGAAIYAEMCTNFEFENCLFDANIGDRYGGALCFYSNYFMTIKNSEFLNNKAEGSGGIEAWQVYDLFLIDIYFYNNTSTKGGVSYLDAVYRVEILNCDFEANQANNGAAFYISNSETFNFTNIYAFNNSASFRGGVFYVQASKIVFQNLTFDSNYGMTGGGFYMVESEDIVGNDFTFLNNYAVKKGGAFLGNQLQNSVFTNMVARNNTSQSKEGGAFIFIESTDLFIDQVLAVDNKAKHGAGIHFDDITNLKFCNYEAYENESEQYGAGLSLYQIKQGEVFNLTIHDNIATINGGAVYIYQSANLMAYDWHLYDNIAQKIGGGAIFFDNNSENITLKNFTIENNLAEQYGGAFYMTNYQEVLLENMQLIQNQGKKSGGQIYITNSISTVIKNLNFIFNLENGENEVFYPSQGNAITLSQGSSIEIENCSFQDSISSFQGGAIYMLDVENVSISKSQIQNSKIQYSTSESDVSDICGGGIYLKNIQKFILNESQLSNNYAQFQGGGIYMYNVQQFDIQNNIFEDNSVYLDEEMNLYKKNETYLLTQGGGIYYQLSDLIDSELDVNLILQQNVIKGSSASSGGGIFFNKNTETNLSLKFSDLTFQNNKADIGPAMRFIGDLGNSVQNSIEEKKNNGNFILENNKGYIESSDIFFGYIDNEHLVNSDTTEFILCTQDKYLQGGGVVTCLPCSENIVCGGGYIPIFPNEHYWRESKDTYTEIYYCSNFPENCKGNDTCTEGYSGLLCEQCDRENNYQKFGDECILCQKKGLQYFSIILLFIFYMVVLTYYIYGVKKKVEKVTLSKWCNILFNMPFQKLPQISAIAKIFIMHCQILYITNPNFVNINFEFQFTLEIFGNPSFMFNPSLLCLYNDSSQKNLVYYLYVYGLFLTILALFCLVGILLIFRILKIIRDKSHLVTYIKMSLSCFFLIIQPGFVQSTLQFLQCREIAGEKYVQADLETNCSSSFYKNLILPINIIFFLLCTIVIPGYILYRLRQQKKNKIMYSHSFCKIYGIYFLEYNESSYFWEFFTMTVKLIVVLLATLIQDQQKTIVKGLFILAALGYYSHYCLKLKPFMNKQLNDLSFFSINIQIMTILLLIFHNYLQRLEDRLKALEVIIVVIVLLINFLFFQKMLIDIIRESRNEFRIYVLLFCKKYKILPKLVASIEKTLEKSKQAKNRWKKIKYGIYRFQTQYPSKSLFESFNEQYMPFIKRIEQDRQEHELSLRTQMKANNSQLGIDNSRSPYTSQIEDSRMRFKSQFSASRDVNDILESPNKITNRRNQRQKRDMKQQTLNPDQHSDQKNQNFSPSSQLIEFEKDFEDLNQDYYLDQTQNLDLPLSICHSAKNSERNILSKRLQNKKSSFNYENHMNYNQNQNQNAQLYKNNSLYQLNRNQNLNSQKQLSQQLQQQSQQQKQKSELTQNYNIQVSRNRAISQLLSQSNSNSTNSGIVQLNLSNSNININNSNNNNFNFNPINSAIYKGQSKIQQFDLSNDFEGVNSNQLKLDFYVPEIDGPLTPTRDKTKQFKKNKGDDNENIQFQDF